MRELTKSSRLFGKAKSKTMTATSKQEIRESQLAVLECVSEVMNQIREIDQMSGIVDMSIRLLHRYKTNAELKRSFVPSKLWGGGGAAAPPHSST